MAAAYTFNVGFVSAMGWGLLGHDRLVGGLDRSGKIDIEFVQVAASRNPSFGSERYRVCCVGGVICLSDHRALPVSPAARSPPNIEDLGPPL